MKDRLDEMAAEMEEARAIGRDAIYRVVVLSAVIVGFSATLLSVKTLDLSVNRSLLRTSWLLFAAAIALGPISVYLESRAKYAVSWRALQAQDFERRGATRGETLRLLAVLAYTILIRPRNLIFARDTDFGDQQAAWLNARMIQKLHVVWDLALALELAFWLIFVAALTLLAISV